MKYSRKAPREPCLFPRCKRSERARGLCMCHYNVASRLVKARKTTWRKLERRGKAKRPVLASLIGAAVAKKLRKKSWFLT